MGVAIWQQCINTNYRGHASKQTIFGYKSVPVPHAVHGDPRAQPRLTVLSSGGGGGSGRPPHQFGGKYRDEFNHTWQIGLNPLQTQCESLHDAQITIRLPTILMLPCKKVVVPIDGAPNAIMHGLIAMGMEVVEPKIEEARPV